MSNFVRLFSQAMEAAGIDPPADVVPDGRLHRFSTNGRASDKAGWYVLHAGAVPSGVFGCWRSGFQSNWSSKREQDFTPIERQQYLDQLKSALRQRDIEQMRIQKVSSTMAVERLSASSTVTAHPYLTAKNVVPPAIAAEGDLLLVPIHDIEGVVHSLQTIDPLGKKRFLSGGKLSGNYFAVGQPDKVIIVCEGYATGLTIHACTQVAIAIAFFAANLAAVAIALRRKNPNVQIIVAADDDWTTPGNPGRKAAAAAALAVNGRVALPMFPAERPAQATDFNDLYCLAGPDAVTACFSEFWEC